MSLNSAKTHSLFYPLDRHNPLRKYRDTWPQVIAWGLVLLYMVTFTWLAILRHASFNSSGFDLGIYDQFNGVDERMISWGNSAGSVASREDR